MEDGNVLDSSIIKDLSNNIYEKRKATSFQIESLTKSALARNDSQIIFKIIAELTELTNDGTNSAKMGAITALGSVSVALGSFAIAYFLEEIIKPIFATFRDTDARVRYYACESLYNIAKIARGEILLYFNEVFDILCILVTDTESSVKNAADILDRLIKDIVSAKSTNYVSILHQDNTIELGQSNDISSHIVDPTGVAIQVNQVQDTHKAFSLPKFIPTLLERMYTIDPFAKKFLISWLELFDDIPALELITFLPNFLEPLIKFLMNTAPSDVRIETQNILNVFLKEIKTINKVKIEAKRQSLEKEIAKKKANKLKFLKNKQDHTADSVEADDKNGTESSGTQKEVAQEDTQDEGKDEVDITDESSIQSNSTTIIRQRIDDEESEHLQELSVLSDLSDGQFLSGQDIFIDYSKIIDILLSFLRFPMSKSNNKNDYKINDISNENHEIYLEVQFTVLKWLQEILLISPTSFAKFLPDCVSINMKNISIADDNSDSDLRNQFLKFNLSLQNFLVNLNETGSKDEVRKKTNRKDDKKEEKRKLESKEITDYKKIKDENTDVEEFDSEDEIIDENVINGLNKDVYDEFFEVYLGLTLKSIMTECLTCVNELSRITLLDWLIFLYSLNPSSFFNPSFEGSDDKDDKIFDMSALLHSSIDASNEVVLKVLQLLSKISATDQEFFKNFIVELMHFFEDEVQESTNSDKQNQIHGSTASPLTRSKIEFIIRKLCVTLTSEKIFKTLSEVIVSHEEQNLDFLNMMIVMLNNILLTTQELAGFRKKLKNIDVYKVDDWLLFATLFQSWCHNAPSALSLCLLTSNYELAYLIIKSFSELEVSFQLLTQLDILVQLLESPIFLKLRLQLLEPEKHPYLYKTLYGLLMILPQSSTFTTLKKRISLVSGVNSLNTPSGSSGPITTPVATPGATTANTSVGNQLSIKRKRIHEMLDKFTKVQESHEEFVMNKKLSETTLTLNTEKSTNKPYSKSNDPDSYPSNTDRVLSHDSTTSDKKDYFSHSHSLQASSGPKNPKRSSSRRFGLHRF
ncbi:uncharacterized protein AC631_01904 [Debaryomyces fabryi]|uniref:Vacuolar protein 14 C-terminal Fig4-binding domain-containing protein n=1 Tax=Debaryomyces fabryi TaxID=58627 RepID=A0A0V1Q1X7_9ASCO|nr:uncharacterized protein AC631_01904 [Debaryomyces fabryi]KSA02346.1 hypothetical protein AC631_01904 [Debaryomyces fabryi]CUM51541.1 unnamed protein product [Debaryomyces fabryi]